MIVKNEQAVLARCLGSVKDLVDEIVIVDTGSTDETIKIAKRYTNKVDFFAWRDDFSAARNYAFSLAAGDYLLWLDADDIVPATEAEKFPALRALLERDAPDVVVCPYESGDLRYERERFLKRSARFVWEGRVHECIAMRGKIMRCGLTVLHLSTGRKDLSRNLAIYRKWAREEPLSGRDLFYYGRELYYHGEYEEAEKQLTLMLKGAGWYVNKIEACKVLSDCILHERGAENSLFPLFYSFVWGEPRASVLCAVAARYVLLERYREAVFWYESAMRCRDHSAEGDFDEPACRTLEPLLGLVVCHWRLGERDEAFSCHKKTEGLAPEHPSVQFNRKFFAQQGHISTP